MHAASEVREAFLEWLDEAGDDLARLDAMPKELRSRLWHCTDTLPGCYCDQLEAPRGSSYAAAVQLLAHTRFCASGQHDGDAEEVGPVYRKANRRNR